jgi:deazaflavin-dependent oxidoreductase (nitroreductase family)
MSFSRRMQHWANARTNRKIRRGRGKFMGMDVLILHTMGRRSGEPRETPVAWFPDGVNGEDSRLIVGSGGGRRHPDWYVNLMAHPDQLSRLEPEGFVDAAAGVGLFTVQDILTELQKPGRDPRTTVDWWIEFSQPSSSRLQVLSNLVYEDNPLVRRAVRQADARFCAAEHLVPKVTRKYRLRERPVFLPTPVPVPPEVSKADVPTVCFNARWDKRKRPELFFELAARFPAVRFLAVGKSRDPAYEESLRRRYAAVPNIEWVGFVDQFDSDRLSRILGESWVLINTASREGLPNSFIEAAAHRCAILSAVDPDGFASRFGHHVRDDDFERGLTRLLQGDRWRERGEAGYTFVRNTFETGRAVDLHLEVYRTLLERRGAGALTVGSR